MLLLFQEFTKIFFTHFMFLNNYHTKYVNILLEFGLLKFDSAILYIIVD